jgi:hypothetical protein
LAPDKPTGTPILIGSAAKALAEIAVTEAANSSRADSERVIFMVTLLLWMVA